MTTTGTDRNRPPVRHRRRRAAQLFSLILFGTVSAGGAAHLWLPDVPAGIPVDTVALDVTPALTLAAVSNVAAFTSP